MTNVSPKRFGWKKTLLYSFLPLIILLVLLETAGRAVEWFVPPLPVDYGLGFNEDSRLFEPVGWWSNRMGVTRAKRSFWFIAQSFVHPKPANEVRVAVFGGSNVNFMHPKFRDLEDRFSGEGEEQKLNIINCGGMSYGSERLRPILEEMLQYDLDFIILYSGHNEFVEIQQRTLVRSDPVKLQQILYSSAACRVLSDLWSRYVERQLKTGADGAMVPESTAQAWANWDLEVDMLAERMTLYEENMVAMVRMAKNHGVPVAIGTLATNYWEPDLRGEAADYVSELRELYAAGKYAQGVALCKRLLAEHVRFQACDVENGILRRVAAAEDATLIDIEAAVAAAEPHGVMGETLLQDECHLNERGRDIWVREMRPSIEAAMAGTD